jgi:hypothetical protein
MTLSWKHIIPTPVKKAGRGVLARTVTLAFRVSVPANRPGEALFLGIRIISGVQKRRVEVLGNILWYHAHTSRLS